MGIAMTPTRTTALLIAATVAGNVLLAATPAAAATSSTTCQGGSTITYNPGLTNTPRTVDYTETDTFASCLSTDSTLTSGLSVTSITLPGASCTAAGVFPDTPYAITWNNGQASQITLSFTDVVVDGTEQVTGEGTVTSGEFTGATAVLVWVYPVLNPLQCASPAGVTTQTGTLTAQITSLL